MTMGPLFITMTTGPDTFYESEFRICDQHMTMGPFFYYYFFTTDRTGGTGGTGATGATGETGETRYLSFF